MIKWIAMLLAAVMQATAEEAKTPIEFKNKVTAGLDGHLRYERSLAYGFHIGTDWRYRLVLEGMRNVHLDQQPDVWFLTVSHLLRTPFVLFENRLCLISTEQFTAQFDAGIRKQFRFEDRWALAPYVKVIQYFLDAGAYDEEWPSRRTVHHGEVRTDLGIELEFLF